MFWMFPKGALKGALKPFSCSKKFPNFFKKVSQLFSTMY